MKPIPGPVEQQLRQYFATNHSSQIDGSATDWDKAADKITELMSELDAKRAKVLELWQGDDSDAAVQAFDGQKKVLEGYRNKILLAKQATTEASDAVAKATTSINDVEAIGDPAVSAAPTGPAPDLSKGATQAQLDDYNGRKDDHASSNAAQEAAADQREAKSKQILEKFDQQLKVAQALLSETVPAPDRQEYGPPGGGNGPQGAGGSGVGTVVGGTLVATGTGIWNGGKGTKPPKGRPTLPGTETETTETTETTTVEPTTTTVNTGTVTGGGALGAAASAGVLGAGKGLLSKLGAGGKLGAAGAPARTSGMQNGSTLGRSGAASTAQGRGAGAGGRGAAAQGGARGAAGRGAAGGSGRGTGGRGGASSTGARPGSRSGAGAGKGAGASGAGRGTNAKKDQDAQLDHLEFEDDQWIDDDETTPGVIA